MGQVWTAGSEPGGGLFPYQGSWVLRSSWDSRSLSLTAPNNPLPSSSKPPPQPTVQAKDRQLGFELTLLFCKCESYKALYN